MERPDLFAVEINFLVYALDKQEALDRVQKALLTTGVDKFIPEGWAISDVNEIE